MSDEAKSDQAKQTELSEEQLEKASGGAGYMYFKDSPIVGEITDRRQAGPTEVVSEDRDTSQAIGAANGGVWKTTSGGDW